MNRLTLAHLLPDQVLPPTIANLFVGDLRLDSRQVSAGDVFICLGGEAYIDEVVKAKAVAVLFDDNSRDVFNKRGINTASPSYYESTVFVAVPSLAAQLAELAGRKYATLNMPNIVGVTGTNGKSTLVSLIAQLLQGARQNISRKRQAARQANVATIGTLGVGVLGEPLVETGMTTPDIFSNYRVLAEFSRRGVTDVAMEVSSHGLSQGRVTGLPITTAVFTNLTQDHLDYHGDIASYAKAKRMLFEMSTVSTAIINADDEQANLMAGGVVSGVVIRYGIHRGDVRAENIYTRQNGTAFRLTSPWGNADIISPLYGVFNVYNLLAAITTAMVHGAEFAEVVRSIPALQAIAGRMQQLAPVGGVQVVVDFAHTPDGLEQALTALRAHTVGRVWVVFGCGGNRDKQKRALMGAIAEDLAEELILTSDNPRNENPAAILADIASGCKKAVRTIVDRKEAIEYSIEHAMAGDCVLIAGKGHESFQIIKEQKIPFSDVAVANQALAQKSAQLALHTSSSGHGGKP
ncbi:MAG TPA: UDP-N-acetylmuramoyl-L-alanyl-D-glutamate--2,6-diaminopimelate ligase [Marinagarivorans sp.]